MAKEIRTTDRGRRDNRSDNRKRELFSKAADGQALLPGLIISRFGQQADVIADDGRHFRCHLRQHLKTAAVGDRVEWYEDSESSAVVVNVLPRHSQLERPNPYEGIKVIAANVDHLIVVVAPAPIMSEVLLDRYLVAGETTGIPVTIVLNKIDLLDAAARANLEQRLQLYRALGYPVFPISTHAGTGIAALREHMKDGCSVIVGQSGVGKSSLINALLPQAKQDVGAISDGSELGQHTTSASRMHFLPEGGQLIDSPGTREFGLWHLDREQINRGFRDVHAIAARCKFRNCAHEKEPGCAVRLAVESGELAATRWQSYQSILADKI
ncbi:small ribosomal subunit biogenesis GTPase RsgA [Permianibacter sp. IMCC34836]|uniref:small ribosomal subunit biogenesis GTPase RsgA n=1 Tax=Permianibacter fluminis TaxID=2738515 RepID=UPI00155447C0|nr:small ribosomal subunit biogenesis GTPase RsgA [Permianibacter fluminis]NQD38949.1 small ribosomal subunit biogenesis GTPase RsgA [Permianibacter fluminis]